MGFFVPFVLSKHSPRPTFPPMPDGLFTFFAALTLGAALLLVLSRNAVTSAMGMILALVGIAADFFLLDAYFLGVLQVLVYAGAVMVLFLFIIMLLDTDDAVGAYPWKTAALGLATFFLLGAGVLWLFHWSGAVGAAPAGPRAPIAPPPAAPRPSPVINRNVGALAATVDVLAMAGSIAAAVILYLELFVKTKG